MLLTITNLYPRPNQPVRGLFNAQLFAALSAEIAKKDNKQGERPKIGGPVINLVLVPEWRVWRGAGIRGPKVGGRGPARHRDRTAISGAGAEVEGERSRVRTHYVPVFHLPLIGRSIAWWFHVRALNRYAELFDQADAVLATWLYPDAVAAGIIARKQGKPFGIKIHGTDRFHLEHPIRGKIIRDVIKDAAGFLPNAQFLADYLVEHGVPASKVHVVRHGIDHDRFHPRPCNDASGALARLQPDLASAFSFQPSALPPIILYVGHLKPIKGPDRLLSAFAAVQMSGIGGRRSEKDGAIIDLVFIGNGPMRLELERQAASLGISEQVHFLGSRPPDEVALWMNVAHCLCLPSRSEGMPNVVLEALASGCPVVATDVGDVGHLVQEGINGFVVTNGESAERAMAAALQSALSRQWGPTVISATTADLSWESAARQVVSLLT